MYRLDDVRDVHLELTSKCSASCPMCPRNYSGGKLNERLPLTELALADVQRILPPDFVRQLRRVYLCGNYGDAIVARDTLEVLEYLRGCSPKLVLGMHTHGSGRDAAWWARVAQVASYVRFGIDGLEDTNALYRRGTSWERVMTSVRAFIGAGGRAEWDFIVFRHNEHQVDAARALANQLGFQKFFAKKTNRFLRPKQGHTLSVGEGPLTFPVLDREGRELYVLEPPTDPRWQNDAMLALHQEARGGGLAPVLDAARICCKAEEERAIYVSAEGLVFPCCYTAHLYFRGQPASAHPIEQLLAELPGGKSSLSALTHPLRDIVEGAFFQRLLPERWTRPSLAEGKLEVCAKVCGKGATNMFASTQTRVPLK